MWQSSAFGCSDRGSPSWASGAAGGDHRNLARAAKSNKLKALKHSQRKGTAGQKCWLEKAPPLGVGRAVAGGGELVATTAAARPSGSRKKNLIPLGWKFLLKI